MGRAARAFAKLGPSIISSPSDLKRLQEAAQVFVSENKDDRAYAVGEKVSCRWKGKDEFYLQSWMLYEDDTYSLVYDDGDTEDGVRSLRPPGDEQVSVSSSVGGLQFYEDAVFALRLVVDYTKRCREELQRLQSSSTSTTSFLSSSNGFQEAKKALILFAPLQTNFCCTTNPVECLTQLSDRRRVSKLTFQLNTL